MGKLEGKIAVVTGGSSGIGASIAKMYATEGAKVIIVGRNENTLKEVSNENDNISYVVGDVTKTSVIQEIMDTIKDKYNNRVDILVNNAGWCPVKPLTEITIEDYDNAFNLDVRAVVELTIHALPLLMESKGNIINMSSVGATHNSPNLSMYQGAKAAIEVFTKVWALELAESGVRVIALLLEQLIRIFGMFLVLVKKMQRSMKKVLQVQYQLKDSEHQKKLLTLLYS